jgi:hypothetical protein
LVVGGGTGVDDGEVLEVPGGDALDDGARGIMAEAITLAAYTNACRSDDGKRLETRACTVCVRIDDLMHGSAEKLVREMRQSIG